MKVELPDFATKEERIAFVVKNNRIIIAAKKSATKFSDGMPYTGLYVVGKDGKISKTEKADITENTTRIKVRSIINTTRLFDSHYDVHIDQLWNKSLKDDPNLVMCNQHDFSFEGVVSDNVKAFTKRYEWKELGYHYKGDTQALVFDTVIDKNDPSWPAASGIFDKYINGKVKQHSVGMRYIQLYLCVADKSYKEYYANWENYIEYVANADDAEEAGFFYAVTAAKAIEGSPVLRGSNWVTPTQSIEALNKSGQLSTDIDNNNELSEDIQQDKSFLFNPNII